jgi:FAD/FMN-containing dehydrogenase
MASWQNWSGSLKFRPTSIEHPGDEAGVVDLVKRARDARETLRVIGSGHSASEILPTAGKLIRLDRLHGLAHCDREALTASAFAGTRIDQLGNALLRVDLEMPNFGDVSSQTIAGALSTGTHGTGPRFTNLSGTLVGGRLVTGCGEILEFSEESDPDLVRAARVSLGVLGIFTQVQLRLLPAYKIERREYWTTYDRCRDRLEHLARDNQHFDFYWYPRSDRIKLRLLNPPGGGTRDLGDARLDEVRSGWAHAMIPKHTGIALRFEECEYHFAHESGLACFDELRQHVLRKWRAIAGWRVLVRWIAPDDAYLSPCHGRESISVSVHQNAPLEYWPYFRAMEEIYCRHGGRPHWAKKHSPRGAALRALYPGFAAFARIRRRLDPDGVFLNEYFRELFATGGA